MYNWWGLGKKKVHREAVKSKIEFFMNSATLEMKSNAVNKIYSPQLAHYLFAVCENQMERGLGPMFNFIIDELFKRGDLTYDDLRKVSQALWMKEHLDQTKIPEIIYEQFMDNFDQYFANSINDKTDFDFLANLDF